MKHDGNDYSSSLTDLMASLAAVFLLIAGVFIFNSMSVAEAAKREVESSKDDLFKTIAEQLKIKPDSDGKFASNACADVDNTQAGRLLVRFKEPSKGAQVNEACPGLAFPPASAALTMDQEDFVRSKVTNIFKEICKVHLLNEHRSPITSINLVGHTDPKINGDCAKLGITGWEPYSKKSCDSRWFASVVTNMPLSTSRAQTVFFNVRETLKRQQDLVPSSDQNVLKDCVDKLFTVAGKGPTEPHCGEWQGDGFQYKSDQGLSSDEQDRMNRRVELVISFAETDVNGRANESKSHRGCARDSHL